MDKTEHAVSAIKGPEHKESHTHKAGSSKKSKPSFQVPVETGAPESAAGWVFRDSVTSPEPVSAIPPTREDSHENETEPVASSGSVAPRSDADGLLTSTTSFLVFGATAIGFAALAAMSLLGISLAAGRMMLPERR
jgi:hypothetical protein